MAKLKTQEQLVNKFGNPYVKRLSFERLWMKLWEIPEDIREAIPALPKKIYVNILIIEPLERTFRELIELKLDDEIITWDGCFNVRPKRGNNSSISTHAFGISVDLNAAWNPFKGNVTWSPEFLEVWRRNGWVCGADWSAAYRDGMHFQWEKW